MSAKRDDEVAGAKVLSLGARNVQMNEDLAEELRLAGVPPLSAAGNAERFAAFASSDFRFVHGWDRWLTWDGKRWADDSTRKIIARAIDAVRLIKNDTAYVSPKAAVEIAKHALKSEGEHRIRAMLDLARSLGALPTVPEQWDQDPDVLNVANGTLDLRTGRLSPHSSSRLLTKLAPIDFDPNAEAPTWEKFLATALPDVEVREYLRRAVGYSLTGRTDEHCLIVCHGTGANGKSTALETIREAMGEREYANSASPDLLLAKKQDRHQEELADLRGARFVTTVEIGENRAWDEARVKWLTGGDTISARKMYGDRFSFQPTHKLWVATNHKPRARGTDHGFWRRIHLVPFTVTIPEAERDRNLRAQLRTELPGILRWAVEGTLEWRRIGLKPPAAVRAATEDYRSGEDVLAAFIDECCIPNPGAFVTVANIYEAYKQWAENAGEFVLTKRAFGEALGERTAIERQRGTGGVWRYNGVGLKSRGAGE